MRCAALMNDQGDAYSITEHAFSELLMAEGCPQQARRRN
jgi:hypothetical protein